jgi:hypothetical protein
MATLQITLGYAAKVTNDQRPGLDPRRVIRLIKSAIERLDLELAGHTVLTEAATGAYAVTPILAAMAGAEVFALANTSRYSSAGEIEQATLGLAHAAGVGDRIQLVYEKTPELLGRIDILTNSGQVRPIDKTIVSSLKPSCVVPLMYEAWEYRSSDVDLGACRSRNIAVAGTNERHPAVDVFSFLGPLAIRELHEAGIAVQGSHILSLCDNAFAPFIAAGLKSCGARVTQARNLTECAFSAPCDAVLVALQPQAGPVLTAADAGLIGRHAPGAVVVQCWGDIDRTALADARIPVWPPQPPPVGHMAVLLSAIGPEAIVRLQAGGLKVGEVLSRGLDYATATERALIQPL